MDRFRTLTAFVVFYMLISLMGSGKSYSQLYNGYSINMSYGIFRFGWHTPDEYLARMYKEPFYQRDIALGTSFELFRNSFQSVLISANYKFRLLDFEYDKKNSSGAVIGTNSLGARIHSFQFSITERLRYHFRHIYLYVYAGPRFDLNAGTSADDPDFNTFLNGIKPTTIGLSSGAGIGLEFSRFFNMTFETYFEPDFTKAYTSSTGYLKSSEFGIRLGFWLVKKSGKK